MAEAEALIRQLKKDDTSLRQKVIDLKVERHTLIAKNQQLMQVKIRPRVNALEDKYNKLQLEADRLHATLDRSHGLRWCFLYHKSYSQ